MDSSAVLERIKPYWLPIMLGVAGMMFLVYGLVSLNSPSQDNPDILFESASDTSPLAKTTPVKQKTITVDIEGGVMKPGVYDLPADSRVQDGLIAAGGMSSVADRAYVSKSLNLAAKVTDGSKIYIPIQGEAALVNNSGGGLTDVLGSGTVNLNTASLKELDSLSGIGEVTAQKIISNRPYASVDELLSKKIVGQKVFADIKDKVSVY